MKHHRALIILGLFFLIDEVGAASLRAGLGVEAHSNTSVTTRSQWGGTHLRVKFEDALTEGLQLRVGALAQLQSGSSRSLYSDAYAPKTQLLLEEALLVSTLDSLKFSFGAIAFSEMEFQSFSPRRAFAGAQQRIGLGAGNLSLFAEFSESIAASESQVVLEELDSGVPLFLLARAGLNARSGRLEAGMNVGYFQFSNLPSSLAERSAFLGSHVSGLGRGPNRFLNEFSGILSSASLKSQWSSEFISSLSMEYINNLQVSEVDGSNILIGLGHEYRVSGSETLGLKMFGFQLGGDTFPAEYGNAAFGHLNRRGYGAEISLRSLEKSKVSLGYSRADTLSANSFQDGMNIFYLQLESNYYVF